MKVLKGTFPEKCIGCELCVLAAERLLGKVGIEGAPIKILTSQKGFNIHLDPSVNTLDIKKIAQVCPKACFTIEEVQVEEELDFKMEEDASF